MEETLTVEALFEFVLVAVEAHCASLSPKERVGFLKRMDQSFEAREAAGAIASITGPRTSATARLDRITAHEVFRAALPRLMAP